MKRIKKGWYQYKGYEIISNENGYWLVYLIEKHWCLDFGCQYQGETLKDCKEWIDSETK